MQDMSGQTIRENHDLKQSIVGKNGEGICLLAPSCFLFPTGHSLFYEDLIPLSTQTVASSATARENTSYFIQIWNW